MKKLLFTIMFLLVAVSVHAREITLIWDANTEQDLDHYVVYWGIETGNYTNNAPTEGLENTFMQVIPDDGQTYYFAVTAVDTTGLESDYSNEVNTEGYENPDEYLYLPPAAPGNNTILNVFNAFPDGTTIKITEPGHAIVTYPNGMIIEIIGTVVNVINQPE